MCIRDRKCTARTSRSHAWRISTRRVSNATESLPPLTHARTRSPGRNASVEPAASAKRPGRSLPLASQEVNDDDARRQTWRSCSSTTGAMTARIGRNSRTERRRARDLRGVVAATRSAARRDAPGARALALEDAASVEVGTIDFSGFRLCQRATPRSIKCRAHAPVNSGATRASVGRASWRRWTE